MSRALVTVLAWAVLGCGGEVVQQPPVTDDADFIETSEQEVVASGTCTVSGWYKFPRCCGPGIREEEYRWCTKAGKFTCFAPEGFPAPGNDGDLCPRRCVRRLNCGPG